MFKVIRSDERFCVESDDQKTWKTFDPENKVVPLRNGFGVLKLLNEELISPGGGFTLHTEKDMVVVTYVMEGVIIYKTLSKEPLVLEAKDFGGSLAPKDSTQYAFNTSQNQDAHVFQCGFDLEDCEDPCEGGSPMPQNVKKLFTHAERQGVLKLIASSDGREASLAIQQDVQIYSTYTFDGNHLVHKIGAGRTAWVQVVKGKIVHKGLQLATGDGVGITHEKSVSFTSKGSSEILMFDLCGTHVPIKDPPVKKPLAHTAP